MDGKHDKKSIYSRKIAIFSAFFLKLLSKLFRKIQIFHVVKKRFIVDVKKIPILIIIVTNMNNFSRLYLPMIVKRK